MLWSSWHNHTGDDPRFSYCADRDLSPDVYRRLLRHSTWQSFALTEHAFALALPDDCDPWPFQWYYQPQRLWTHRAFREDKTARYLERMGKVCDGQRILSGMEVEVACDGSLSMEAALWPYIHVVVGSMHFLPNEPTTRFAEHFRQLDMLLEHPIDILGHPFRELSRRGPVPDEILEETLLRAREVGVAVEINAHMPFERDPDVLACAVRLGVRVAFGLDAHHRSELGLHTYFAQVVADSAVNPDTIRHFEPISKTPKPRQIVR